MTTTPRPWQAQERFEQAAGEVKAPLDLRVLAVDRAFSISWKRRPGFVDGFIILVGSSPTELKEHKRVMFRKDIVGHYYQEIIDGLTNGDSYYVTVIAYKDGKISEVPEVWKAIPNVLGKLIRSEKVEAPGPKTIELAHSSDSVCNEPPEREQKTREIPMQVEAPRVAARPGTFCASCNGEVTLKEERKLFVCSCCNREYVQRVIDGKLLAVATLSNGICSCCSPKRPLIQPPGEDFRKCSRSGERYTELAGRGMMRISELDYGICQCCTPPNPLRLNQDGQMICSRNTDNLYVREGKNWTIRKPEPPPALIDDLDKALAEGGAVIGPGGILMPKPARANRPNAPRSNTPGRVESCDFCGKRHVIGERRNCTCEECGHVWRDGHRASCPRVGPHYPRYRG